MKFLRKMKRDLVASAVLLGIVASAVPMNGCAVLGMSAGNEAREHALAPAIVATWENVRTDVEFGLTVAELRVGDEAAARGAILEWNAAETVGELVDLRDRDWVFFESYAAQGIGARRDAGEIGVGVSTKLMERLGWFGAALQALDGEPTDPE